MAWINLGVAAVGITAGAIQGAKNRKQQRDLANQARKDGANVFGTKPEGIEYEPVHYTPVNYGDVQMDTIHNQQKAMPDINSLTASINKALRDDSETRINGWVPGFTKSLGTMGNNASELLNGRLPFQDVLDIVSKRQELSNTLGTPGTSTNATLRDLGLSRLDAMNQGGDMMSRITQLAQAIDPMEQRSRPQDWMYTPSQSIPWKIQEQQFGATLEANQAMFKHGVDQNNAVLAATGDPSAINQFGASYLQNVAGGVPQSGGQQGGGVNYAQIASMLGQAYQAYQGQQGGGGYGGGANYYGNTGYNAQQQYWQNNYGGGTAYANTYGMGNNGYGNTQQTYGGPDYM